jgi:hypothetical protein
VDDSTNVLGFNCGGEQWVYEACFPIGTAADLADPAKGGKDIEFVKRALAILEEAQVPAHSPIEQRWSARSKSPMSPAFSKNAEDLFSWVGIIMYLPPRQTPQQREEITASFDQYVNLLTPLFEEYGAVPHWAKVEVLPRGRGARAAAGEAGDVMVLQTAAPDTTDAPKKENSAAGIGKVTYIDTVTGKISHKSRSQTTPPAPTEIAQTLTVASSRNAGLKDRLHKRYDAEQYEAHRRVLDPHNILSNMTIDTLFPAHEGSNPGPAWKKRQQ